VIYYVDPATTKGNAVGGFLGPYLAYLGWAWPELGKFEKVAGMNPQDPTGAPLYELPELRPPRRCKVRGKGVNQTALGNDLIAIAASGAAAAGLYSGGRYPVRPVKVSVWKGQIAKPIHHNHLWEILLPHERELFPAPKGYPSVEAYIKQGVETYARTREVSGYGAGVVDLLDVAALGCYDHNRLRVRGAWR
jgi:hypothetical protein